MQPSASGTSHAYPELREQIGDFRLIYSDPQEAAVPADLTSERDRIVDRQIAGRGIADRHVLDAMRRVPRERLVAPGFEEFAYEDAPLPIDEGQTISPPYIVGHCSLIPISYSEESMRFRRAAIECSRAALIDGQVNVLRWRAPEADPQFGAPQILMLSQLEEDGHSS